MARVLTGSWETCSSVWRMRMGPQSLGARSWRSGYSPAAPPQKPHSQTSPWQDPQVSLIPTPLCLPLGLLSSILLQDGQVWLHFSAQQKAAGMFYSLPPLCFQHLAACPCWIPWGICQCCISSPSSFVKSRLWTRRSPGSSLATPRWSELQFARRGFISLSHFYS